MIENTYSDMGHPLYEWIKSGNAWSPAWEYYCTGYSSQTDLRPIYSEDVYNCYAVRS